MDNHYEVNESLQHARKLMEPVRKLTANWYELVAVFQAMNTMKDGDGSQASHFQKVVDLYGVAGADANAKLAAAKAIYDELNSTVNGAGKAAILQLLARLS